jgi:cell wall-associated NlpC family hydrolase
MQIVSASPGCQRSGEIGSPVDHGDLTEGDLVSLYGVPKNHHVGIYIGYSVYPRTKK